MSNEDIKYLCQHCYGEQVPYARAMRCINDKEPITCAQCGEAASRKVKRFPPKSLRRRLKLPGSWGNVRASRKP